ncbi:hypothetical protein G6F35_018410 [Rhizopus arrhizus]|nr:hypothetical protein G6F35_018410 [Rhizopus arrhizus]
MRGLLPAARRGAVAARLQLTRRPSSVGRGRFPASEHQRGGPHDRAGAVKPVGAADRGSRSDPVPSHAP